MKQVKKCVGARVYRRHSSVVMGPERTNVREKETITKRSFSGPPILLKQMCFVSLLMKYLSVDQVKKCRFVKLSSNNSANSEQSFLTKQINYNF